MRTVLVWFLILAALLCGAFLGLRDPDIPYDTLVERYASPPSQFVELKSGLTAHVRQRGPEGAPVLLLLHGSNASLFTWEPWAERLSKSYRVVSVDLLGHGLSSLSPDMDYTNAAYIAFLGDVVEALGLERFTLVGNSMGGGIAWRYALDHGDRLDALVLVDASGITLPAEEYGEEGLIFKIARTPVLNKILLHFLPRSAVEAQLKDAIYDDAVVTSDMVDRYHAFLLREGRRSHTLARMQSRGAEAPMDDRLGEIEVPTLILWGAEDTWVPTAAAPIFKERIPDATLIIYDKVGHIPMEEVPDESASDLHAFLLALAGDPHPIGGEGD